MLAGFEQSHSLSGVKTDISVQKIGDFLLLRLKNLSKSKKTTSDLTAVLTGAIRAKATPSNRPAGKDDERGGWKQGGRGITIF